MITVLKDMLKHVIPGSRHNSAARDPPPRCHPGTRTCILQGINVRTHDQSIKMIWLFGIAGAGKSAVMQTVAETLSPCMISTTLFLSRTDGRDDPSKILITLAYGFAVLDPVYCRFIQQMMALDPDFLSLNMDEQFKRLFIQPFVTRVMTQDTKRWVIILDGLDECQSEEAQCKIVDLIRASALHQSTPLLWIISSRPEPHLKASFSKVRGSVTGFWEQEIPITSQDASEDLNRYLHAEFANIREVHAYSIPSSSSWPSDHELHRLSTACSGFFGFGSAAMKYIAITNPVSRLQCVLSSNCPLEPLDSMYRQTMSNIPSDELSNANAILGFYLVYQTLPFTLPPDLGDIGSLGFLTLCNILRIKQHDAYAALHKLSSLLTVPPPEEAKDSGIRFHHPSFLQFLNNGSRSQSYCIGSRDALEKIWHCYLDILRQVKKSRCKDMLFPDSCFNANWSLTAYSSIDISWPPDDGTTSSSEIQQLVLHITQHGWISILINFFDCQKNSTCRKDMCMRHGFIDSRALLDILNDLGPIILDCAESDIQQFIKWVTKSVSTQFL